MNGKCLTDRPPFIRKHIAHKTHSNDSSKDIKEGCSKQIFNLGSAEVAVSRRSYFSPRCAAVVDTLDKVKSSAKFNSVSIFFTISSISGVT